MQNFASYNGITVLFFNMLQYTARGHATQKLEEVMTRIFPIW